MKPGQAILNAVLCLAVLAGCATPVLEIEEVEDRHREAAVVALESEEIAASRDTRQEEMSAVVGRVLPRVRNSAHAVCQELGRPQENCELMLTATVHVFPEEQDMNAFADHKNDIGIYGGLIANVGSDEEIAAVLSHEFAHVMYDHVSSKMTNAAVGMIVAAGLALAVVGDSQSPADQQAVQGMMEFGAAVGATAYSPEMELEADRTAIYILARAGYDTDSMKDVIVRMHRASARQASGASTQTVGFLQTHPSDNRRVAHIISSIEDANAGVPLVVAE